MENDILTLSVEILSVYRNCAPYDKKLRNAHPQSKEFRPPITARKNLRRVDGFGGGLRKFSP